MWKSRPFSPAASGRPRNYRGFRTLVPGIWGTFLSPARPLIKSENVDGFSRLVFLLFMRGDSCRKFPENFPLNTGKFCPPFSREMPVPAREPLPVEKWISGRGIPVQARCKQVCRLSAACRRAGKTGGKTFTLRGCCGSGPGCNQSGRPGGRRTAYQKSCGCSRCPW